MAKRNDTLSSFLQGLKAANKPIVDLLGLIAGNTAGLKGSGGGSNGLLKGILETALGVKLGDLKSSVGGRSSNVNIHITNNNYGGASGVSSGAGGGSTFPTVNPVKSVSSGTPKGDDILEALGFSKPVVSPKSKSKKSKKSFWDEAFPGHEWDTPPDEMTPLKLVKEEMETIKLDLPKSKVGKITSGANEAFADWALPGTAAYEIAAKEAPQPKRPKRPKKMMDRIETDEDLVKGWKLPDGSPVPTRERANKELGKEAWKKMKDEESDPYQIHSKYDPDAKSKYINRLANAAESPNLQKAKTPSSGGGEGLMAAAGTAGVIIGAVLAAIKAGEMGFQMGQSVLQPGDAFVGSNQGGYNKMLQDSSSNQTDMRVLGAMGFMTGTPMGLMISGIMRGTS